MSFYEKYRKPNVEGIPKYIKLREAIIAAVEDHYWAIGSQLPSEDEICRMTPYSLGTVQKALKNLVDDGILIRRQGLGTFVSDAHRKMERPWHLRFARDREGTFLPVYPRLLWRGKTRSDEPWARLLNPGGETLIRIDRKFRIGDEFSVYSKIFLNEEKFVGLLKKPIKEIEKTNLKNIIRKEYDIPITHMSHSLRVTRLPDDICPVIGVAVKTTGLVYDIFASFGRKNPVYYSEVYIPPNGRRLHISDTSNVPEYWME